MTLLARLSHRHVILANIFELRFLPPLRPKVSTGTVVLSPARYTKFIINLWLIFNGVIMLITVFLNVIGH